MIRLAVRKTTKVWGRGLIATAINGFSSGVVLIVADPVSFNLQEGLRKLVMTSTVFALMGLANYLKQHPLPDDDDVVTLDSRTIGMLFLPLLMAMSACATAGAVVTPKPPVETVEAVRAESAKLAIVVREAGKAALTAYDMADAAYKRGEISAATMQKINATALAMSSKALTFADFAETVTTDANLKSTAKAVYDVFQEYIAAIKVGGIAGTAIQAALGALKTYLGVQ